VKLKTGTAPPKLPGYPILTQSNMSSTAINGSANISGIFYYRVRNVTIKRIIPVSGWIFEPHYLQSPQNYAILPVTIRYSVRHRVGWISLEYVNKHQRSLRRAAVFYIATGRPGRKLSGICRVA